MQRVFRVWGLGVWASGGLGVWGFGGLGVWGFGRLEDWGFWGFGGLGVWGLYRCSFRELNKGPKTMLVGSPLDLVSLPSFVLDILITQLTNPTY